MSSLPLVIDSTSPATGEHLPEQLTSHRAFRRDGRPQRLNNPLQAGIREFLLVIEVSHQVQGDRAELVSLLLNDLSLLPKRFTIYTPLLLLPPNFLPPHSSGQIDPEHTSASPWHTFLLSLTATGLETLWGCLVSTFQTDNVSHIAIGAPIQLEVGNRNEHEGIENLMRSPTGIRGVYGDFGLTPASQGPGTANTLKNEESEQTRGTPSTPCIVFDDALWVHSTQNGGIFQVWAPMWTMFSRGNIKEKARILSGVSPTTKTHGSEMTIFPGLISPDVDSELDLENIAVVDMYVGIGYFAFSYLKRGIGLVIGFELNPWSVEGLRRGAEKNGWKCQVVILPELSDDHAPLKQLDGLTEQLSRATPQSLRDIKLLVFQGDNRWAKRAVPRFMQVLTSDSGSRKDIRHINLGLLPTSSASWSDAERLLSEEQGGWIHVHENVGVQEIQDKAEEIETEFKRLVEKHESSSRPGLKVDVQCVHIEKVKTYAPGVMHCVFDIRIDRGIKAG